MWMVIPSCISRLQPAKKIVSPAFWTLYHAGKLNGALASIRFILDKRAQTCSFGNSLSVFIPEDSGTTMSVSALTCYQTPGKIWNYGNI